MIGSRWGVAAGLLGVGLVSPAVAAATVPGPDVVLDLSNAAAPPLCGFPAAQLIDGRAEFEPVITGGFETIWLAGQATGDIDGDGIAEVAGLYHCNRGGSAVDSVVVVFRKDGTPIGAMPVYRIPDPGFGYSSAVIGSLAWQPGSFRVDGEFELAPGDVRTSSSWLTLIDGELYVVYGDDQQIRLPRTLECGEPVLGENQGLTDFSWRVTDCETARSLASTVSVQHFPWGGDPAPHVLGFSCTFTELPVPEGDAGGAGRYDCTAGDATVTWSFMQYE
jgi:hypothetical protein